MKCKECGYEVDQEYGCLTCNLDKERNDRPIKPFLIGKTAIAGHLGISPIRFIKGFTDPSSPFHAFKTLHQKNNYYTHPTSATAGWENYCTSTGEPLKMNPKDNLIRDVRNTITDVSSGNTNQENSRY